MFDRALVHALHNPSSQRSLETTAFTALFLLFLSVSLSPAQSVQAELAQIQKSGGYRLVAMRDNKVSTVSFADGSLIESKPLMEKGTAMYGTVSPDGKKVAMTVCQDPGLTHPQPNVTACPSGFALAIVGTDGTGLREDPEIAGSGWMSCWSHDMSKLVLIMDDRRHHAPMPASLQILDLKSGTAELIADGPDAIADAQCWSPDDKKIVYMVNKVGGIQTVRLYDTGTRTTKDIADGGHPSWSPDGNWIAFLHCPPSLQGCAYKGIRVSTGEEKAFFQAEAMSSLSWSPDSRFVAYFSGARAAERSPSQMQREMIRLRVRRLADSQESSFHDFFDGDVMWFSWAN
jgi:WD40 repeat protein